MTTIALLVNRLLRLPATYVEAGLRALLKGGYGWEVPARPPVIFRYILTLVMSDRTVRLLFLAQVAENSSGGRVLEFEPCFVPEEALGRRSFLARRQEAWTWMSEIADVQELQGKEVSVKAVFINEHIVLCRGVEIREAEPFRRVVLYPMLPLSSHKVEAEVEEPVCA